ncbi:hypothetical protein BGW38_002715, partial [Lunasporangiospora selenospora]
MGGEMIFEHKDGCPIGSKITLYESMLEDIKKATEHLKLPDPRSSELKDVDLGNYELCLDLGEPYYILFPKNPDTHKVLSSMHARNMSSTYKTLMSPLLTKLERSFTCFSLDYGDGNDGHSKGFEFGSYSSNHYSDDDYDRDYEYDSYNSNRYSDDNWNPDYTACSSSDC